MRSILLVSTAIALGLMAGCSTSKETAIQAPASSEAAAEGGVSQGTSTGLPETERPGESIGVPPGEK